MKGVERMLWVCFGLVALSGCSAPASTREAETGSASSDVSSREVAFLIDDRGLVARSFDGSVEREIDPEIQFAGDVWPAPGLARTAVTVTRGEKTHLMVLEPDGGVRDLHSASGAVDYTAVWAPTGDSLLFGYRGNDQRGVGVFLASSDVTTDVGCSASSIAHSWGQKDWFVVGDEANQYIVERDGCGTIESIDSRKMHEIAFGPKGARTAFVLRQLEYDQTKREYRPDSSLYVATSVGTDPILVAGDRYRPHRPAWSPDGSALAFDARLPDDASRRLISVFDVETKQSAFLNPKAVSSKVSERSPSWSPSGAAIAYLQWSAGKEPTVSVRNLSSSYTTSVGKPGEILAGWLPDERLVLQGNGRTRVVGIDGKELLVVDASPTIIASHSDPLRTSE